MLENDNIHRRNSRRFLPALVLALVSACAVPDIAWEEVEPGLYLFGDCANVYALVEDNRACLIGFATGAALDHLDQIGVEQVDMVLVTHHHRDGLQGISRAVEAGIDIVIPAAEAPLIESAADHWRNKRVYVNYDGRSRFNAVTYDVPVSLKVAEGDVIEWGDSKIEVLDLPGHTDGSVAYGTKLNSKDLLFSGDFYTAPGKTLTYHDLHWNYTQWNGFPEAVASAQKLATLVPALVCPDHGTPFTEEGDGVEKLLANLDDLEEVFFTNNKDKSTLKRKTGDSFFGPHIVYIDGQTYAIVSESRHAIVYDPGYGNNANFNRFKQEYGIKSVDALTFSHYHDDHVARTLAYQYHLSGGGAYGQAGAPVWILDEMADIFAHPERYNVPCIYPMSIPINRVIAEDEVVHWEGLDLTFKHFPGQTWYHGVVLFEAGGHRYALTGDSVWEPQDWDVRMNGPIIPRNRYFLGDGYERVFQILLDYDVDVIVPAHYDPFTVKRSDLEKSLKWAESIEPTIDKLVDQPQAGYGFDPHWAHFYPYRLELEPGQRAEQKSTAKLLVRNYFDRETPVEINLILPPGVSVGKTGRKAVLPPDADGEFDFQLTIDSAQGGEGGGGGRRVILAEITLDGHYLGQVTEMLIDTPVELPDNSLK
ncbi:MBL fold metallo-hydrolase [candidate division KSB1 bacterium]